eukprot:GFUD01033402.1.p1 GENE.GFUD01033402.1~~GFUD01033402.1.p1  ORF type:complete len:230 (+),score=48.61 GFUD01033402.1:422-1111(+)
MRVKYKLDTITHKNTSEYAAHKTVLESCRMRAVRGIFVSWSNTFFLSRPVEDISYFRTIQMVLIQVVCFPINLTTHIALLCYIMIFSLFAESLKWKLGSLTIGLIVMETLSLVLVFCYCYRLESEAPGPTEMNGSNEKEALPLIRYLHGIPGLPIMKHTRSFHEESLLEEADETKQTNLNESTFSRDDTIEAIDVEDTSDIPPDKNENTDTRDISFSHNGISVAMPGHI